MAEEKLFKEKAYKILYEKYRDLYIRIFSRAQHAQEYGQKEDHTKLIQTIVDIGNYDYHGIQNKEDNKIVNCIEYLLDDSQSVR